MPIQAVYNMQITAIICLAVGIAAAVAGIILQSVKIKKTGKADKKTIGTILFAVFYIIVAVINFIFVIPLL